ncbi:MAG: tetratricopeptide repeat protein [Myxococcales bacterium]|nr:tetratricopeptide repeat protein [Myxococcales bacterium]
MKLSTRVRLTLLLLLCAVLAGVATQVQVSLNLADALPREGETGEGFADVSRFSLLDVILIDIDGAGHTEAELHAAIDVLGGVLEKRLGTDLASVRYSYGLADGARLLAVAEPSLVLLTDSAVLEDRLSEAGMTQALQRLKAQMFGPASALAARQIAHDPLGLGTTFTTALSASKQAGTRLSAGHLLSADGTHGLVLARAASPALGTSADSPIILHLAEDLAKSPLPADWVGSHRYAAEASGQIQSEVNRAVTTGTIGVLLVFLVAFRSFRPLAGIVPPLLVGSLFATAVAAIISPIHGIALAFGGALAGMGVDYWIHLYLTGVRDGVKATFTERIAQGEHALRELMPAYLISVGATVVAFIALATSAYQAVSDLGIIGVGCSIGAFLTIALAGPAMFAVLARPGDTVPWLPLPVRVPPILAGALLGGLALLGTTAIGVRFDGAPRSMDARLPATATLEETIRTRYGGEATQGLVVAEGDTLDEALDRLAPAVAALAEVNGITVRSPLELLPSPGQRAERAKQVSDPATLEARFIEAADAEGFDAAALLPGFRASIAGVQPPVQGEWDGTVGAEVLSRTVQFDPDGHAHVAAIVVGVSEAALAHAGRELDLATADQPDESSTDPRRARFVYPAGIAAAGAACIRDELVSRSGLALLAVLIFMLLRYRDTAQVVAASLPSLGAAVGALGVLAWWGIALTPVSGPAFVLVLGLAFDQGIFLVETRNQEVARANRPGKGLSPAWGTPSSDPGPAFYSARAAIFIALATAFAGFVGLCAAEHPAVFGVGLTESLGIAFTALTAFAIVPAVLTDRGEAATRRWARGLGFVVVMALQLDALLAMQGWIRPPAAPANPAQMPAMTGTATDRRVGPNRLVRRHGIWVEHLEGDPYTIGRADATLAGPLLDRDEAGIIAEFFKHVQNPLVQYALFRGVPLFGSAMASTVPDRYLTQLRGYTDTADDAAWGWIAPHYTRKLCYHAIHDVGQAMVDSPLVGCTGFVASGSRTAGGATLLARNFDFDGGPSFDAEKAVIAIKGEGVLGFAHIAIVGLQGVVTGLNEARIGVGVLAASSDARPHLGTPMIFIVREILENARSLDDVERILDARRGFVSEGILAIDGKTGETAIFEVTPADVHRLPPTVAQQAAKGDPPGIAQGLSNHFRGPHGNDLANHLRMIEGTTTARLARIEELLARTPAIDHASAIAILRDRRGAGDAQLPDGHESSINADIAAHGAVIDATAGTISVSTTPNLSGRFLRFSVDRLLAGDLEPEIVAGPDDPDRTWRVQTARELVRTAGEVSLSEAEKNLRRALRLNPGDVDASLELGRLLAEQGRTAEASPLLDAVIGWPERSEQARDAQEALR